MTEHPIEHKIARAKEVFARHGDAMLGDPTMTGLLNRYRDAIGHAAATMRQLDAAAFCSCCAGAGPGSCCSTHVEAWYDPMLLFMIVSWDAISGNLGGNPRIVSFRGHKAAN